MSIAVESTKLGSTSAGTSDRVDGESGGGEGGWLLNGSSSTLAYMMVSCVVLVGEWEMTKVRGGMRWQVLEGFGGGG